MITATLKVLKRVRGEWRITIQYNNTDTNNVIDRSYRRNSITKKGLRNLARSEAATIDDNQTHDIDIAIGTAIDVTPDAPTPPTQAELDKTAWVEDWRQLQRVQKVLDAVPALATTARQQIATDLQTSLTAGWKNAYLGDI